MTDFPFDLIGFDLDGTLVDSAPDLAAAVNHVLASAGRQQLPVDAVRSMIGGGARVMLRRALEASGGEDGQLDRLYPRMIDYYAAHIADLTRPFPRLPEVLGELRARGVALAVVTNKLEHLSVKLLEKLGLLECFACVIGGDTLGIGKPDPAPIDEMVRRCGGKRPAFVGDTAFDVEGAHAAGLPCALFLPSGGDRLGADTVFADYADLLPVLVELGATRA